MEIQVTNNGPKTSGNAHSEDAGLSTTNQKSRSSNWRSTQESISAGLEYLFSRNQDNRWFESNASFGGSDAWVTAYVLSRLGEFPDGYLDHCQRQQIQNSLDWLEQSRTPHAGWGYNSRWEDDADSTSWALIALRRHGRAAPQSILDWIASCRSQGGGFAAYPDESPAGALCRSAAADVTAISIQALRSGEAACQDFLLNSLANDLSGVACRLPSRLLIAATILDWERGTASRSLLDRVGEIVASERGTEMSAFEQGLLLRCLLRLRSQKAWTTAAELRRLQLPDGSWPGSAPLRAAVSAVWDQATPAHYDQNRTVTTATVISALVMGDSQPGLYFGSDRPLPRRLKEY